MLKDRSLFREDMSLAAVTCETGLLGMLVKLSYSSALVALRIREADRKEMSQARVIIGILLMEGNDGMLHRE
jgi:hypothetical protein